MGEVLVPVAVTLLALLLLAVALVVVVLVRRRVLTRGLGTFEASLRHETILHRGRWSHGIARYGDDRLDWFGVFAVRLRPAESLVRHRLVIIEQRLPDANESHSVLPGWVIVRCGYGPSIVELAMSEGACNGLAAWLESAPPGQNINVA